MSEPSIDSPVVVSLRWTAEETLPTGKPLTLTTHEWRGWVIGSPADWAPLLARLNALSWGNGFEVGEDRIGAGGPWVVNRPAPHGQNPPMLWVEDDHAIGCLSVDLRLRRDIPREWSDQWHERAWLDLEARLPAWESAFEGLFPMPLGRMRAEGKTHWANRAPRDAAAWRAQWERQILRSTLPESPPASPSKPRPGL